MATKKKKTPEQGARELLRESYELFRKYEAIHKTKGTKEGSEKAKVNGNMANKISRFLAKTPDDEG